MLLPLAASAALVDPSLRGFAEGSSGSIPVIVLMDRKFSHPLPARSNGRAVRVYLRDETRAMWNRLQGGPLANLIARRDLVVTGVFAVNQSFSANVTPVGLRILANTAGLTKIYAEGRVNWTQPVARRPLRPFVDMTGVPYDLRSMGLDQLAATDPGLNGTGVLVGHIDTGVDGRHPALAGKIAKFFEASTGKIVEPYDTSEHGTHTAGTIVGSPRDGAPIGVAPGARLISAAGLTGYTSMLKSMEFMLDPDGNPDTEDAPRLVSNSWNCGGAPDLEAFYRGIDAWEAAGIFTLFSAGNSGPSPRSLTKPHEHPLSFSIAAHDQNGMTASFSSRGPGTFNGQDTLKPDVSAPGVDIVSSLPGGNYGAMSGTSMATPHVAGLIALLLQVEPSLTPARLREVIAKAADYVDPQGKPIAQMVWNPAYGYGRINAVKAVALVKNLRARGETRWGSMIGPTMDLIEGFARTVVPTLEEEAALQTVDLMAEFPTDKSVWIDGSTL